MLPILVVTTRRSGLTRGKMHGHYGLCGSQPQLMGGVVVQILTYGLFLDYWWLSNLKLQELDCNHRTDFV